MRVTTVAGSRRIVAIVTCSLMYLAHRDRMVAIDCAERILMDSWQLQASPQFSDTPHRLRGLFSELTGRCFE